MKLVPFNRDTHKKLLQRGYGYVEIKQLLSGEQSWVSDAKDLQILKALDIVDTLPVNAVFVSLESEKVESFLSADDLHYFVIVDLHEYI